MPAEDGMLVIGAFLDDGALAQARQAMDRARYQDGAATATDAARAVKRNLQVDPSDLAAMQVLQGLLLHAVNRSQPLREQVLPKELHDPRFARYDAGMGYDWHVDSPLMGHPPVRTDFAMTVFLEGPEAYEGGELELQTLAGLKAVKLPAGSAVVYPCAWLHRVAPVSAGQRRVMVTWIQSLVPDPRHRAVLAALQAVQRRLDPASLEALELQQQIANLTRLWVRT
jgi:PKHD-type hydroxylase